MIREIGTRPAGVAEVRRAADDVTEVWLGARKLFEIDSFTLMSANVVEVDWSDLDRTERQLEGAGK